VVLTLQKGKKAAFDLCTILLWRRINGCLFAQHLRVCAGMIETYSNVH
jgi:hypothetical protein